MIFSGLFSLFQKGKEAWLSKQEAKFQEEFSSHFQSLKHEFDQKKSDLEKQILIEELELNRRKNSLEDEKEKVSSEQENLKISNSEFRERMISAHNAFIAEQDSKLKLMESEYSFKHQKAMKEIDLKDSEVFSRKSEIENILTRIDDKKEELQRKNQELSTQIRLIEAKASPDHVWATAFQAGFSKCWEVMWEFQSDQVMKLKDKIKSQAINETLGRLNGHLLPKI